MRPLVVLLVLGACSSDPEQSPPDPTVPGEVLPTVITDAQSGDPELTSAQRIAFGPAGHLAIGDGDSDRLVVVSTGDLDLDEAARDFGSVADAASKAASALGVDAFDVRVTDIAVNPRSGRTWVSIERLDVAWAGVFTVEADRSLAWVDLAALPWVSVPYPEADGPGSTVTDLEWTTDWIVAATNEAGWTPSQVVTMAIPVAHQAGSSVTATRTYHRTHQAWETQAPITTLFSWSDGDTDWIGASYQCAPVVRFDVEALAAGDVEVVGVTPFDYGGGRQVTAFAVAGEGEDLEILASVSGLGGTRVSVDVFERDSKVDEEAAVVFGWDGEPTVAGAALAPKLERADRIEVLDADRLVLLDGTSIDTVDRPK